MCLTVKQGCAPEIAQKDITCWKLVDMHLFQQVWMPFIYTDTNEMFPLNKVATARNYYYGEIEHLDIRKSPIWTLSGDYIDFGFHARIRPLLPIYNICIIPKGAEYCLGEDDDIVATKMIVFGTLFDYLWYKLKK